MSAALASAAHAAHKDDDPGGESLFAGTEEHKELAEERVAN